MMKRQCFKPHFPFLHWARHFQGSLSAAGSFSIGCSLMGKAGCFLLPSTLCVLNSLTVSKPEVIELGLRLLRPLPCSCGRCSCKVSGLIYWTPRESPKMSPFLSGAVHPKPYGEAAEAWRGPRDVFWRIMGFLGPQLSQLTLMPLSLGMQ